MLHYPNKYNNNNRVYTMTDEITEKEQDEIDTELDGVSERLEESNILTPELMDAIKKQVTAEIVEDMKEKKVYEEKERDIRREQEDMDRANYIAKMKASDEPWCEMDSKVRDTEHGSRVQMEWNDAFIVYLKQAGLQGSDDEQLIQQYLTLLLRDTVDKYEERYEKDSDFQ